MPAFPREELEDIVERWLEANREAEGKVTGGLADFYTDDATYGWNIGPKEDVMCVGIGEIRDIALGQEMEGLEGWRYPYQRVIIDDRIGEVVGFWNRWPPTQTARSRRSTASVAAGFATPVAANGIGNVTSSTSVMCRRSATWT